MPLLAVALLSAGVLAQEVLLARLLAIVQWHHFAYMVISVALLGFGASGTVLVFAERRLRRHFTASFAAGAALFGVAAPASFAIAQRLPFNALAIVWDPAQLAWLPVLYLLFALPFFGAGLSIGLAFSRFPYEIARIYRYDLVGAALGAPGAILALFVLAPPDTLRVVAALGLAAAALALWPRSRWRWAVVPAVVAAVAVAAVLPPSWLALRMSEYKGLSLALLVPGAEVAAERSGPLGLLTVVRNETVPFRHVPGASLGSTAEPPPQLAVFTDGDAPSVITRFDGRPASLAYLDQTTGALPYHLVERPEVLVLGAGGGADVLLAVHHEARRIDAVELNPQVVRLVGETYAEFAGRLHLRPEVEVHVGDARGFVTGTDRRYDVIQLPLLDSFTASSAGTLSLNESTLYTVEAFDAYLGHLRPEGTLAITRWLKLPPRDSLKLVATAALALERMGVADPGARLALIRGWSTTTLLVKAGALSLDDVAAIRGFARDRSFDIDWLPGAAPDEANRYNIVPEPTPGEGVRALLGPDRAGFVAGYAFDIAPATDDRPYFFNLFRWRSLPELFALRSQGSAGLLDWGYLIVLATLAQAAVLSVVLILLPLPLRRWRVPQASARGGAPARWRIAAYFLAIGLAFLFCEMASIQRFTLFLGHPLTAVAVVLAGFLLFAGLGAGAAPAFAAWLAARQRAGTRWSRLTAIDLAAAAIALLAVAHALALPPLFRWLIALPEAVKVPLALALIAPLAFCMGMPFPLALARLAERAPALVPWAWGINGCASVISAVLATLLAIDLGFTAVLAIAAVLYLVAAAILRPAG